MGALEWLWSTCLCAYTPCNTLNQYNSTLNLVQEWYPYQTLSLFCSLHLVPDKGSHCPHHCTTKGPSISLFEAKVKAAECRAATSRAQLLDWPGIPRGWADGPTLGWWDQGGPRLASLHCRTRPDSRRGTHCISCLPAPYVCHQIRCIAIGQWPPTRECGSSLSPLISLVSPSICVASPFMWCTTLALHAHITVALSPWVYGTW